MHVSEARIAANRENAKRSTGPKTPEGKARSRANSLKHGLCSTVVVAEDLDLVRQRTHDWTKALKPQNTFQAWLVGEIAILSIRIDRGERMERRLRDRHSLRAEVDWDEGRRQGVEALGATIGRKPGEVVEALRRTPRGCDWLIGRWAMLACSADARGAWTPEQARLAFDLLGTPAEVRDDHPPGTAIDREGRITGPGENPAAVARLRIAELEQRREAVAGLDQADQALAVADLFDESNAELKRLRRYEATLHTRLRWCMTQLRYESPYKGPHADAWPQWAAEPEAPAEPTPMPEPEPPGAIGRLMHPPFDLEPEECPPPGTEINLTAILANRRDKQARKAESRRQARRRKIDRLRAG